MEKCEYIEVMQKAYFEKPQQNSGKCAGFINITHYHLKCDFYTKESYDVSDRRTYYIWKNPDYHKPIQTIIKE